MNPTVIRRLYGSSTASTNDLAHLDIVSDSILTGIDISISAITATGGDRVQLEISTASICQATTNDCQGVLANADYSYVAGAAGATVNCQNKFCGPTGVFIPRGTRIYMSTLQAGTSATRCTVNLHLTPL